MKAIGLRKTAFTLLGVLFGLGGTTLHYAEVFSYLSTDPSACVNCHIMRPQYDAWQKASHNSAATCADCHLPATFPKKYLVNAENGWGHSKAFTMQNFYHIKEYGNAAKQLSALSYGPYKHAIVRIYRGSPSLCSLSRGRRSWRGRWAWRANAFPRRRTQSGNGGTMTGSRNLFLQRSPI